MNVHVNLAIVMSIEMVMMRQRQQLQHASYVRQRMVIEYVVLANDDVQVVRAFRLIVSFHDLKERDRRLMDLEKRMLTIR